MRLGIQPVRIGGRSVFRAVQGKVQSLNEEHENKSAENHASARVERKAMRHLPRLVAGSPKALRSTYRGIKSTVQFTAKQAQTFKRKQAVRQRIKQASNIRNRSAGSNAASLRQRTRQSRRLISGKTAAQRIRTRSQSLMSSSIRSGGRITLRKGRAAIASKATSAIRTKQKEAEKCNSENYAASRTEQIVLKAAPKAAKVARKTIKLGGRTLWAIPRTARRIFEKQKSHIVRLNQWSKRSDIASKEKVNAAQSAQNKNASVSSPRKAVTETATHKKQSQARAQTRTRSQAAEPQTSTRNNIPGTQPPNAEKPPKLRSKNADTSFRSSSIRGKNHAFKTRTASQSVTATPQKDVIATRRKHAAIKKAKKKASGQVTSRAAQQAKALAIRAAKRSAQLVKDVVKAAAAAVKALIAAIGGGALFIALIALIAGAAFIFASPWGIFFGVDDPNSHPIPQVVAEINAELRGQLDTQATGSDTEIDMEGDALVSNWIDVLGVFCVKTTTNMQNPLDVGTMDDEKKAILKQIFLDMNEVSTVQENVTETDEQGNSSTKTVTKVKVVSKRWEEMIPIYGFNAEQEKLLRELMAGEYYDMFIELLGLPPGGIGMPLSPEDWDAIAQDLPPGQKTTEIVKLALSKLGATYDNDKRWQEGYYDCSSLVYRIYKSFGLEVGYPDAYVAASQGEWCVNNNVVVSYNDLQPGDLVFFSSEPSKRFKSIDHVAIYAGNGKVIDASKSRGRVVYRDIWTSTIVLCGRPSLML